MPGMLSQLLLSASRLGAHLDAPADVIHNPDCPTVLVSWQRLGKSGDLHLPFGLGARLLSVDGFTGGTLQAAILPGDTKGPSELQSPGSCTQGPGEDGPAQYLVPVGVHGQHTEHVEGVLALPQAPDSLGPDGAGLARVTVARGRGELLHADHAVLEEKAARAVSRACS